MDSQMTQVNKGGRPKNSDVRPREYLTNDEMWSMVNAARKRKGGRNNTRDAALIEIMYRHALRASEACLLKWEDVSIAEGLIKIKRVKGGSSSLHQMPIDEIRTMQRLKKAHPGQAFLFPSEGGGPMDRRTVFRIVKQAGQAAGFAYPIHPHMLRHGKGYNLINRGKEIRTIAGFMGHRNISSTMRYTEVDHRTHADFAQDVD